MFLRSTKGDWMMTMPERLNMDWVDSIKVRSIFNSRFTLSIWCHNCIFIFELHNLFTACFRVFHGKNSTILYRDSWDITNLELQVCRYASNVHNVDLLSHYHSAIFANVKYLDEKTNISWNRNKCTTNIYKQKVDTTQIQQLIIKSI